MSTNARKALLGAGAAIAGGSGLVVNEVGIDNVKRSYSYNQIAIPGFIQYKYCDWKTEGLPKQERDAEFAKLHEIYSSLAVEKTKELRGFYLKNAQLIATNVANMAPKIWQEKFLPFLDDCPAVDFSVIRNVIETDLGAPLSTFYSEFDEVPLASASIGQVHAATLRSTGERVAVKVQFPDAEPTFRNDVRTIKYFCKYALPEHEPVFEEVEKQFITEFDYTYEAKNLQLIHANLTKSGMYPDFVVPKPYMELCSKNVLTQDLIAPSQPILKALTKDLDTWALLKHVTVEELKAEEARLNEEAESVGVNREGPSAQEFERINGLISKGNSFKKWFGWLPGAGGRTPVPFPVDHAKMIDRLFAVHGHTMLIDGAFNGDNHP
jgi:aarF domain-containing kinase